MGAEQRIVCTRAQPSRGARARRRRQRRRNRRERVSASLRRRPSFGRGGPGRTLTAESRARSSSTRGPRARRRAGAARPADRLWKCWAGVWSQETRVEIEPEGACRWPVVELSSSSQWATQRSSGGTRRSTACPLGRVSSRRALRTNVSRSGSAPPEATTWDITVGSRPTSARGSRRTPARVVSAPLAPAARRGVLIEPEAVAAPDDEVSRARAVQGPSRSRSDKRGDRRPGGRERLVRASTPMRPFAGVSRANETTRARRRPTRGDGKGKEAALGAVWPSGWRGVAPWSTVRCRRPARCRGRGGCGRRGRRRGIGVAARARTVAPPMWVNMGFDRSVRTRPTGTWTGNVGVHAADSSNLARKFPCPVRACRKGLDAVGIDDAEMVAPPICGTTASDCAW